MRDIACGSWRCRCGVFKIEILKLGGSSLAAEICAEHNRLLRRQHCSSLCSQSEGHEPVANMPSALGHDFVEFLAVFGRHNIRPPHFASKVSYSASPQPFAKCPRIVPYCATTPIPTVSARGSRHNRCWEQRRTHLGAETVVAGCRGERRWDGVQLCLLLRALTVVRTGFTEVGFYQW